MNRPLPAICAEIVEQPKQRGMRFRYECEGRSAGSIPGENTTQDKKTWPTCQIHNYSATAVMRVSLVSINEPPRPHPHSLVGRDCSNGVCQITIDPSSQMQGVFPNLGIQCVRRREVSQAIQDRLTNGVNPFNTPVDGDERSAVDVDLNIVRLCFEVFLPDQHGHFTQKLPPVVSNPIYDKKATSSSVLKICRVDKNFGSALGNEEIFLLCDKVQKEDIQVVFSHNGWEALGDFSSPDVHRQVAIVFKTPPYRDEHIRESVQVEFKLRRPSDMETSAALEFTYLPIQHEAAKKVFPSAMHARFAGKRKLDNSPSIRSAIIDRTKNLQVFHPRPEMQQPVPSKFQPPAMYQSRPRLEYNPPFTSLSAPRTSMTRQPFSGNMPGSSGLGLSNMAMKHEDPFSSFQSGALWNQQQSPFPSSQHQSIFPSSQHQAPFPNSQHQQSPSSRSLLPPSSQQAPSQLHNSDLFSSPLLTAELPTSNLPDLSNHQSLTDILTQESFHSLGVEITSQMLENTASGGDGVNDLDLLMERHCSMERDPRPQIANAAQDLTLMNTGITQRPISTPSNNFMPGSNSPRPSAMFSPGHSQVMSPPGHFPPSHVMSPQQQLPPTPNSFVDMPVLSPLDNGHSRAPSSVGNMIPYQNFTLSQDLNMPNHQDLNPTPSHVDFTLSPQHQGLASPVNQNFYPSQQSYNFVGSSNNNNNHQHQLPNPRIPGNHENFMGNNNNQHLPLAESRIQTNNDDSLELLLKSYTSKP